MNRKRLYDFTVEDICEIFVSEPSLLSPSAPIEDLFNKMIENPITRHIYLVDDDKRFIGAVELKSILSYLSPHLSNIEIDDIRDMITYFFENDVKVASNFCSCYADKISVKMDDTLEYVLKLMYKKDVSELPIIDNDNRVIGEVNMLDIIATFNN
jgi:CBS domain-containing protein